MLPMSRRWRRWRTSAPSGRPSFRCLHAQQAIFTIHVESRPLAEAIGSARDAASVHAALASMSDAVLAYRGLTAARERLLAWLAARA